jgi:hypothetical protein
MRPSRLRVLDAAIVFSTTMPDTRYLGPERSLTTTLSPSMSSLEGTLKNVPSYT